MVQPIVPQTIHSSYPRGMCRFTNARTVAIVFARSAGNEAMYCAGVLTFAAGFIISSSPQTQCITEHSRIGPQPVVAPLSAGRAFSLQFRGSELQLRHDRSAINKPGFSP